MRRTLIAMLLGILTSCAGSPGGDPAAFRDHDAARNLYRRASELAMDHVYADAFAALEGSMQAGYPAPSDVLRSDALRGLLDSPEWRPRMFELLKASARESSIWMSRPEAPGEPMILTVRIVGSHREPPDAAAPAIVRAGVVVGLVHVDAAGYYQPWTRNGDWNPRHFGFTVTDRAGMVVVRTIRPGYYAPEYDAPNEPAHVHYNIEQSGVLLRASEFFFDDDPRLVGEARGEAEANRVPIATVVRDEAGVWRAEVTIPVRGLR